MTSVLWVFPLTQINSMARAGVKSIKWEYQAARFLKVVWESRTTHPQDQRYAGFLINWPKGHLSVVCLVAGVQYLGGIWVLLTH